jgi:hypothetical protein
MFKSCSFAVDMRRGILCTNTSLYTARFFGSLKPVYKNRLSSGFSFVLRKVLPVRRPGFFTVGTYLSTVSTYLPSIKTLQLNKGLVI